MRRTTALFRFLLLGMIFPALLGAAQAQPAPTAIPAGSKVFIRPIDGFETWLMAGFAKKKVPLRIVSDIDQADFEISGTIQIAEPSKWEKIAAIVARVADEPTYVSTQVDVAISVTNRKTGEVVYGYAWHGMRRAQQSAAEACAKNIKAKVEGK
ncbi:MAG: hypothetical protein HY651_10580 [Acidobacteria bacterium]|nr:hypothetical protein [Acidobacteriota bacterium]